MMRRLLAALCLLIGLLVSSQAGAWTHPQTKTIAVSSSSTSWVISPLTSTGGGNLVTVAVASSQTPSGVTDNAGNTYYLLGLSGSLRVYYRTNVTGGATSVTVAFGSAATGVAVVDEWSGGATNQPLDVYATTGSTTSPVTVPAVTTTTAGDLVVNASSTNNTGATATAGGSYTIGGQVNGGSGANSSIATEYQTQGAAGSISPSTTWSAGTPQASITIAFHPAGFSPAWNYVGNTFRRVDACSATTCVGGSEGNTTANASAAPGDLLIGNCAYSGASTTATLTDNIGGTWTPIQSIANGTTHQHAQAYSVVAAHGLTTVTCTIGASRNINLWVDEFTSNAAASPLDVFTGQQQSTTTPTSGNVTTGQNNELVYGAESGGVGGITSPGSGFTEIFKATAGTNTPTAVESEWKTLGSAGTTAATWTNSGTTAMAAAVATFKLVAAAGAAKANNLTLLGVGP